MRLTRYQKDLMIGGLQTRICLIETRTSIYRAVDVEAHNAALPPIRQRTPVDKAIIIYPLSREQRDMINQMEDLIQALRG